MNRAVIIVAGGQGLRMKSTTPKQFMEFGGNVVIFRSIEAFTKVYPDIQIVVVLGKGYNEIWNKLVKKHQFNHSLTLCTGGKERYESVLNGLSHIGDETLVAVHDAVRPFVSELLIKRLFETAEKEHSAVPVIPLRDTVREVVNGSSRIIPRERLRQVQTPQVFQSKLLKQAYSFVDPKGITDDSGIFEQAGFTPFLVEGEEQNFKLTRPEDLTYAEYLFSCKQ